MSLTGFTRTCSLASGGMKKFYAAIVADVTSFTLNSTYYNACTMVAGKVFKEFQFDRDTFELKETETIENGCKKIVHSVEFYISKMSADSRAALNEIMEASACGLIAIVEDNNGTKWTVGYSQGHLKDRALSLKGANSTSGKKLTDQNGTTITLESEDTEKMRIYSATVPVTNTPAVTSDAITEITSSTATGGGNVTDDGELTVTERGVCWSTHATPTTSDSKQAAVAGGEGTFTVSLTSLSAETAYHARAYAINSAGTSYGTEVEFETTA
jgi:hypothetical protein